MLASLAMRHHTFRKEWKNGAVKDLLQVRVLAVAPEDCIVVVVFVDVDGDDGPPGLYGAHQGQALSIVSGFERLNTWGLPKDMLRLSSDK